MDALFQTNNGQDKDSAVPVTDAVVKVSGRLIIGLVFEVSAPENLRYQLNFHCRSPT